MIANHPPEGWTVLRGTVEPSHFVAAYAARAQRVRGNCRDHACTRRVTLDAKTLCGKGLGRLQIDQVKQLFRCGRVDGCRISWRSDPAENPLRLEHFIGRPNVRVRVSCRGDGCSAFTVRKVEEMIAALRRRKVGDGHTEVDKLAPLMTSPCRVCKKADWRVSILWIDTDTIGWRQIGERLFDEADHGGGR